MNQKSWIRSLATFCATLWLPLAIAADQTPFGDLTNPAFVGPYAKGGVNIGAVEIDRSRFDTGAGGGISLALGYRALDWIAGEIQFDYLGGSEVEIGGTDAGDSNFFDFTFNAKAFPIPLLNHHVLQSDVPLATWVEPYVLFGIGGGELEVDGSNGGPSVSESTFVVRLGGGVDLLLTEQVGVFMDGGFHFTTEDNLDDQDIIGVGVFTLGAFFRF